MSRTAPAYSVSAIVSAYKSERFMAGCLEDLVGQTLFARGELEIVVVDSGSPEKEGEIVERFRERFPHIRYIRTDERESIYRAWNRGIAAARGRYVTNANTDDRHRPDALEVMARELDARPDVALVYGDVFVTCFPDRTFGDHIRCGYHVRPDYAPEIMLSGCHMGPQPMWRRSVHDTVGWFSEELLSAGDYEFWCRLAASFTLFHIPQFLGLYYENPRGFCNADAGLSARETARVKNLYRDSFPSPRGSYTSNYQYIGPVAENRYVNIGMVTYNRLEFTRRAIEALVRNTRFPHVLTVVDNGSSDGTPAYLRELKRLGVIRNLVLLDGNVGVAKGANLAWSLEPAADYYLKLDNDIVIEKQGWLEKVVAVCDAIPEVGAAAYNFEPKSYPLSVANGHGIRIKEYGNLGGACILIPRRTERLLGCWCEDYGLYSEEDADYGFRVRRAGLLNVYLEDEEIGLHLPAGKAALIDSRTLAAADGIEEREQAGYRQWKDEQRRLNVGPQGPFARNLAAYRAGTKPLYVASPFVAAYRAARQDTPSPGKGDSPMALSIDQLKKPSSSGAPEPPLVTAIVSSYNAEQFMRECLTDLVGQTIADRLEIIVVDAASPEAEGAVVQDFQRRHANITYIRTGSRIGVYAAWNMATRLARGTYITPMSTNDRLAPDAYERMADALASRPDVALVYGDSYITRSPHETFERHTRAGAFQWPDYSYEALLKSCQIGPHPMWRRSVHAEIGHFDESFTALGDQDFFIRVGSRWPLLHIPRFTGLYWMSPDGLSNRDEITRPELERLRATSPQRGAPPRPEPAPAPPAQKRTAAAEARFARAVELKRAGELEAARDIFATLLDEGDGSAAPELGECLAPLGRHEEAFAAFRTACTLPDTRLRGLIGCGVVRLLQEKQGEAAEFFRRALEIDPADSKALCGLGMIAAAGGNRDEARTCFLGALDSDPENLTAINGLVTGAYAEGRYAEAARRLSRYLEFHPADIDILFSLAGLRFKDGNGDEARECIEKVLLFAPDYPGARELLERIEEDLAA